jgi:hypothetical protein
MSIRSAGSPFEDSGPLQAKDIGFHSIGTGEALIRRGKTDAEGREKWSYLSREAGGG